MKKIKTYTALLMAGLVIAGATAFFIPWGVDLIVNHTPLPKWINQTVWLNYVLNGVVQIDKSYDFIWYGTDWMAFAHLLFAILFYGLYKDPIRNKWLVSFGLVACVAIAPIALGFGHLRGIPLIWQFLDMAFGVIAGALLLRIKSLIQSIEKSTL